MEKEHADGVKRAASAAARSVTGAAESVDQSRAYRALVRVGLVSYGLVHLVIAYLAVRIAFGEGTQSASQTGALRELASAPGGMVILWVVASGLAAITLWQLLSALVEQGSDAARVWRRRISHLGRAVVYAVLAAGAASIAIGGASAGGNSGDGQAESSLTATLLGMPFGRILVGAVALGVAGFGVYYVIEGATKRYEKDLDGALTGVGARIAQFGYIAKGVAFVVIGGLFMWAAITVDPQHAGGLDQALQAVRSAPFGQVLLVVLALGLVAFGVYCFLWARRAKFR